MNTNTDALRYDFEAWMAFMKMGAGFGWDSNLGEYHSRAVHNMFCAYKAAYNAQQAEIDRLMLEFCPSEMTAEQMETWKKHQKRYEENL